jgi:broad specificity phosphatase PhoE
MTTITNICITRHSERIDQPNPTLYDPRTAEEMKQSWLNSTRYKENSYDPYLSEHGKHCSFKQASLIATYLKPQEKPIVIVSSPFTRCIESAGEIQRGLFHQYGILYPIYIEYGFSEPIFQYTVPLWNSELQSFTFTNRPVIGHANNMDEKMKVDAIVQRFPEYHFDTTYQPLETWIARRVETFPIFANRLIRICNETIQRYADKNVLCVGHADFTRFGINYYMNITLSNMDYEKIWGNQGYGACLFFSNDKNKEVKPITYYTSNTQYCKSLPHITQQQIWIGHMKTFLLILMPLALLVLKTMRCI